MPAAPKVFISYSHDNDAHKARVLALADRLRNKGSGRDDRPICPDSRTEGWPLWCEKQIEEADFVLMVCTEVYLRRVPQRRRSRHRTRRVLGSASLSVKSSTTTAA